MRSVARLLKPGGISRREFLRAGLASLAAPALASCRLLGDSVGDPHLSARPGIPTIAPTAGLSVLSIKGARDALLYVPTGYDADVRTPLVVALHGAGGSPDFWASYQGRAEARGFVMLMPDSLRYTWDLVLGEFGPDVVALDRVLAATFERCRIDETRIALAGFSDGASYALSLGVPNGDLFTHLIAYSPGFYTSTRAEGRPRIFVSHGTLDPVLAVGLSRDRIVPQLREEGYDVTYEEFSGKHLVPAFISEAALDWCLGVQ